MDKVLSLWIEKADHDLSSAKVIFLYIPENYDVIGFLCQQAVEKYLKGYLVFLNIKFKYLHDLAYLLDLISTKDISLQHYYDPFIELSNYAVKIRYTDIIIKPTKEELKYFIELAEKIREIVTVKIGFIN